jgi:hypothetical protein
MARRATITASCAVKWLPKSYNDPFQSDPLRALEDQPATPLYIGRNESELDGSIYVVQNTSCS